MKKRPAIYGIGWIDAGPDAQTASASPKALTTGAVTLSYLGETDDDDAARALASAVRHEGGSGAYPLAPATAAAMPAGEVADLLADMIEDECSIVVIFSADNARTDDGRVALLRDVYDSGRPDAIYGEARWWPTADASIDPYPLIDLWAKQWPDSLPIAHELKELFEDQWVRFHSVPGAKRAPASDAEWATVMDRHNAVLADLATLGEELIVIMSVVASTPAPAESDIDFWTSVPWHYADPDLLFAHLFVTTSTWNRGSLDDLLRMAAEQQIGGVIIAPTDLSWLYHPYAGGLDVIIDDPRVLSDLSARYPDWRSAHPSGL